MLFFLVVRTIIAKIMKNTAFDINMVKSLSEDPFVIKSIIAVSVIDETRLVDTILPTASAFTGIMEIIIFFRIFPSNKKTEKTSSMSEYTNIPMPSNSVNLFDNVNAK